MDWTWSTPAYRGLRTNAASTLVAAGIATDVLNDTSEWTADELRNQWCFSHDEVKGKFISVASGPFDAWDQKPCDIAPLRAAAAAVRTEVPDVCSAGEVAVPQAPPPIPPRHDLVELGPPIRLEVDLAVPGELDHCVLAASLALEPEPGCACRCHRSPARTASTDAASARGRRPRSRRSAAGGSCAIASRSRRSRYATVRRPRRAGLR